MAKPGKVPGPARIKAGIRYEYVPKSQVAKRLRQGWKVVKATRHSDR